MSNTNAYIISYVNNYQLFLDEMFFYIPHLGDTESLDVGIVAPIQKGIQKSHVSSQGYPASSII